MTTRYRFACSLLLCATTFALGACTSGGTPQFSSSSASSSSSSGEGGIGGAGAGGMGMGGMGGMAGMGGAGGAPITYPQPCADIYDQNTLQTFELTFSQADLAALATDCANGVQQYRPVVLKYGAETVDAMARLKGNWSWDCNKMQFIISFNEIDPKGRFHGLRKIVLDAPWYDRTLLHERLAMPFFEQRGLPYSCVNNARLYINGQYYGLYANVERLDKEYLQRHFELADGNLYEGGKDLKTNETIGDTSDLVALDATTTTTELAMHMDLDQAVAEWATEAMLPAMDNYWAGVEINYYIYHHPARGFIFLPYDMDIVFGDSAYPDGTLVWPDSAISDPITYEHPGWLKEDRMKMVLSDNVWCQKFVDQLVLARAAYSPTAMSAKIDTWNAQIQQALMEDQHKPFSMAAHSAAITSLKSFLTTRASFVDQWLAAGNHCPAQF